MKPMQNIEDQVIAGNSNYLITLSRFVPYFNTRNYIYRINFKRIARNSVQRY
jgi:hypothetical protein